MNYDTYDPFYDLSSKTEMRIRRNSGKQLKRIEMLTCARFSTTRKSSVRPLRTGDTNVGADVEPVDRKRKYHVTNNRQYGYPFFTRKGLVSRTFFDGVARLELSKQSIRLHSLAQEIEKSSALNSYERQLRTDFSLSAVGSIPFNYNF